MINRCILSTLLVGIFFAKTEAAKWELNGTGASGVERSTTFAEAASEYNSPSDAPSERSTAFVRTSPNCAGDLVWNMSFSEQVIATASAVRLSHQRAEAYGTYLLGGPMPSNLDTQRDREDSSGYNLCRLRAGIARGSITATRGVGGEVCGQRVGRVLFTSDGADLPYPSGCEDQFSVTPTYAAAWWMPSLRFRKTSLMPTIGAYSVMRMPVSFSCSLYLTAFECSRRPDNRATHFVDRHRHFSSRLRARSAGGDPSTMGESLGEAMRFNTHNTTRALRLTAQPWGLDR